MSVCICDLETVALPDEVILKNLPAWDEAEARTRVPKNYKKEEAINGWLEEDKANHGKDALEKAALNPETATIAIVGFWKNGRVEQLVLGDGEKEGGENGVQFDGFWFLTEAELIEHAFLRLNEGCFGSYGGTMPAANAVLGWNLHGMELKFLIRRAWILGVKVPKSIYNPLLRYPIPERFVDMMERYGVRKGEKFTSLNNALKAMGLPEKGDGKEFGKLWREDRSKALAYSAEELNLQAQLYRRMGVEL